MQNPDEIMALAVTAFQHWRTSRAHRVVKTPPALQQQAAALRASFSSSKIMKALSVSGTNLNVGLVKNRPSIALLSLLLYRL
jgi:hypothetical protein